MSSGGGWKQVKKKRKGGGNPSRNPIPRRGGKGGGGGGGRNQKKKKNAPKGFQPPIQREETVVRRDAPIGGSGAPKMLKKMKKNQKKNRKKNLKNKKKTYTNQEKVKVEKSGGWFDPNKLHENVGDDTDYYYSGTKQKVIQKSLAEKIRKNREKHGMSRNDFATAINEKEIVVRQYELCECAGNQKVLQKMAKVLGVNLGKAGKKMKDKKKDHYFKRD